jgi:hypothetical protein
MVGLPYDDVDGWRGPYPADIFANQFEKVSQGWNEGIALLQQAVAKVPAEQKEAAEMQLRFAQAAQLHFASVANQVRFTVMRNQLLDQSQSISKNEYQQLNENIHQILQDEIDICQKLFTLSRQDSLIAFEASNHYYYVPADLIEKVINCRYIAENLTELYHPN